MQEDINNATDGSRFFVGGRDRYSVNVSAKYNSHERLYTHPRENVQMTHKHRQRPGHKDPLRNLWPQPVTDLLSSW